jgi:hypothetical protein
MAKNKPMSKPMLDSIIEKPNSKYGGLYLNVNEAQLENSKNLLIELKKREAELRKNKKLKTFTVGSVIIETTLSESSYLLAHVNKLEQFKKSLLPPPVNNKTL